jgi:ABC-type sugar transport system ATPase subunit
MGVSFEDLAKTYPNGHTALSGFTLDVSKGELLALVGPSGCGKSTLLRLVAGLESPSAGSLRIGGRRVDDLMPQHRNIAMVFQDYALYPTMTVRENLEFPLKMKKLERAEMRRRLAWAVDLLALNGLLDRLPKQLSGGQRQRVAMGRALVREPSVFLLDEPLSNLDAQLRGQVRTEIAELQRRTGTTMIYVTHDQVEAMTMGHRIAVLRDGRLQQVGEPHDVYQRPANTFVAGFIGTPAMNLLPGRRLLECWDRGVDDRGVPQFPRFGADRFAAGRVDRLTAGIRPEHLSVGGQHGSGLSAVVVQTEYLGHETLVHFRLGDRDDADRTEVCIARIEGLARLDDGQPITIGCRAESVLWFGDDGQVLSTA